MSLAARLILVGAAGFLILVILAAWLLRDQIYQTFQDPGEPFQTYTPPPAPDYAEDAAWFLRQTYADETQPALFFVHSTTYSGGANWNAELDKDIAVEAVERSVLPNYAAPFIASGALQAPRYRQAALYAFLNNREDGVLARHFAHGDVASAFDRFLAEAGPDRPIILAGVGQGGLHVLGLLMNRVAPDEALRNRLVAAYAMETVTPLDLFNGPLAEIPPCESPDAVRCLVSYAAARREEEKRIRILTERTMSWAPDGRFSFVEGRGLACVNPVLGAQSEDFAPPRLHRGGAAAEGMALADAPAPQPRQTSTQCQDGVLIIDRPRSPALRRPNRLVEHYRVPPANLFYEDLRLDAAHRVARLAEIRAEEARWAPPLIGEPEDVREAPVTPIEGEARG